MNTNILAFLGVVAIAHTLLIATPSLVAVVPNLPINSTATARIAVDSNQTIYKVIDMNCSSDKLLDQELALPLLPSFHFLEVTKIKYGTQRILHREEEIAWREIIQQMTLIFNEAVSKYSRYHELLDASFANIDILFPNVTHAVPQKSLFSFFLSSSTGDAVASTAISSLADSKQYDALQKVTDAVDSEARHWGHGDLNQPVIETLTYVGGVGNSHLKCFDMLYGKFSFQMLRYVGNMGLKSLSEENPLSRMLRYVGRKARKFSFQILRNVCNKGRKLLFTDCVNCIFGISKEGSVLEENVWMRSPGVKAELNQVSTEYHEHAQPVVPQKRKPVGASEEEHWRYGVRRVWNRLLFMSEGECEFDIMFRKQQEKDEMMHKAKEEAENKLAQERLLAITMVLLLGIAWLMLFVYRMIWKIIMCCITKICYYCFWAFVALFVIFSLGFKTFVTIYVLWYMSKRILRLCLLKYFK